MNGTISSILMLKTPNEHSGGSGKERGAANNGPPASPHDEISDLTDGRPLWQWRSKYTVGAWISIGVEGAYLVSVMLLGLVGLYKVGCAFMAHNDDPASMLLSAHPPPAMLIWMSVALGGACGGCAFALKWLYHGVAYGKWHRDRLVWRLVVPILSGALALFTALMVSSGILPIFSRTAFDSPTVGAAFGFFIGFFSDNLLAGLQKTANHFLGTLERPDPKR